MCLYSHPASCPPRDAHLLSEAAVHTTGSRSRPLPTPLHEAHTPAANTDIHHRSAPPTPLLAVQPSAVARSHGAMYPFLILLHLLHQRQRQRQRQRQLRLHLQLQQQSASRRITNDPIQPRKHSHNPHLNPFVPHARVVMSACPPRQSFYLPSPHPHPHPHLQRRPPLVPSNCNEP